MFQPPFQLDACLRRILHAEAAKIRAHASLHHAHTFGVRLAGGIPKSAQICGRSAFLTPSKSIRWLPVIFTIGTLYFSATSAIRRNSFAEVTPPRMRGTTENVPSF